MEIKILIDIILGLALLSIILSIFFVGENSQGKKILQEIPNPLKYLKPNNNPTTTQEAGMSENDAAQEFIKRLREELEKASKTKQEECFLTIPQDTINLLEDSELELVMIKSREDLLLSLEKQNTGFQTQASQAYKAAITINNLEPCLLLLEKNKKYDDPEELWSELFSEKAINNGKITIKFNGDEQKIIFNGDEYEWRTYNNRMSRIIYKNNNQICLIPSHDDYLFYPSLEIDGDGTIDDDLLTETNILLNRIVEDECESEGETK